MKLKKARVTNYRSILDTGWVDIESEKTIMVGPNEAGKTAFLRALQQINPPSDIPKLDPLQDYPRSKYNDITKGNVDPAKTAVVVTYFELSDVDRDEVESEFHTGPYVIQRNLDNSYRHWIEGAPETPVLGDLRKGLQRLAAHVDGRYPDGSPTAAQQLEAVTKDWTDRHYVQGKLSAGIKVWLEQNLASIDEDNNKEEERYDLLLKACLVHSRHNTAAAALYQRLPLLVLFSNYYRVRPLIHLAHLATRIEQKLLDDDQYDYGNECLLRLLGFTARELSDLGRTSEPNAQNQDEIRNYRDQLDKRSYQLNAASVKLTSEIVRVWNPNPNRQEADRLRITADGQYLKVVVEDDLGVEIELDQRSEGFQWLVSFFVVFFSETEGKH